MNLFFYDNHFQTHLLDLKCLHLDSNFTEAYFEESSEPESSISLIYYQPFENQLDNGLVQNRH